MLADSEEKPEGAPEWMVSFADMITILMSFFVVMFSIASGDSKEGKRTKQQQIALESLQFRFGPKWKPFMSFGASCPAIHFCPAAARAWARSPRSRRSAIRAALRCRYRKRKRRGSGSPRPRRHDRNRRHGLLRSQCMAARSLSAARTIRSVPHHRKSLAGKPQQVEIVATASSRALPPGCAYRDRWEHLGYSRCRRPPPRS